MHEGEEILVQVVKDPIGEKGARLSANVTLPGRLLVIVPNQPGIALSRRIEDEAERARLIALGEAMIAEANGAARARRGLYLAQRRASAQTWPTSRKTPSGSRKRGGPVMAKRQSARAPATLYHDLDPVERTMRDEVDAATVARADRRRAARSKPRAPIAAAPCRKRKRKIELFDGPGVLFDLYDLEDEIERLLSPRVPLPSGGWITIEGTEALTAIDVNSGSFTDVDRAGGNEPQGQSRSGGRDRPPAVPARHRRTDRDRLHPFERARQHPEGSRRAGGEPRARPHADADLAHVGIRPRRNHAQAHPRSARAN